MAIYILLSRLSQQGVATLKSNPDRLREVNRDVEELGAKVLHQWATLGEFDFVNVVEAPDTATIARVSVALGARGSTKIQTLPALSIDDFIATLRLPLSNGATAGARPQYVCVTPSSRWCDGAGELRARAAAAFSASTRSPAEAVTEPYWGLAPACGIRQSSVTAATRRTVTPHAFPDAKSLSGSTSTRQPMKCGSGLSSVQPKTAGYFFAGVCSRTPRACSSARRSASSEAGPSM
jgi:uncharacterized protein with GYD domain